MFGTDLHKLFRRDAISTSKDAAKKVRTKRIERLVFEKIKEHPEGCTQEQILNELPEFPYPSITARFSALIEKGLIEDTGQKRLSSHGRNQRVLRAIDEVHD